MPGGNREGSAEVLQQLAELTHDTRDSTVHAVGYTYGSACSHPICIGRLVATSPMRCKFLDTTGCNAAYIHTDAFIIPPVSWGSGRRE